EPHARGVAQVGGEVRGVAGAVGVGALAAYQIHGVGLQVVHAHAGALVGVGDGAAALEAPLARGRDRPVDAARAGGGGGDDAGVGRVERGRYVHHQGDVLLAGAVVGVGEVLVPGDSAFAQGVVAVEVDVRAVEHAVAAAGRHVDRAEEH